MKISNRLPPQSDPPLPPWQTLPSMYDLPSENTAEPGWPDYLNFLQVLLLDLTFQPSTYNREETYSACDVNLYYHVTNQQWYKRPDWFAVVGVSRLYKGRDRRLSYVNWQERRRPIVVVELSSLGREDEDLDRTVREYSQPPTKWVVYEQILRVTYYFVFNRYTSELQAFHRVGGHFEPMESTDGLRCPRGALTALPRGHRWWIPTLGLSLGLWQGDYQEVNRLWLRWMTEEGELIPVESEVLSAAETRAAEAEKEAAAAKLRAEKLAQLLQEFGVNPAEID